jgi:hypothetical protein
MEEGMDMGCLEASGCIWGGGMIPISYLAFCWDNMMDSKKTFVSELHF